MSSHLVRSTIMALKTMALSRKALRFVSGVRCSLYTAAETVEKTSICHQNSITAGIIVIGDEVLKGQVKDTNSYFIAKNLSELGVRVKKISIIGDDLDQISSEVRWFSEQFTYVITTGGIGPTHDDITYEAVAQAFNEKTEAHPELVETIKGLYQDKDITSAALKFAHIPTSAKLTYGFDKARGRKTVFPNVSVRNVYIFPGVPDIMEYLFSLVYKEQFGKGCKEIFKMNLYLSEKEFVITDVLNTIVKKFPNVKFGSYPQLNHSYYFVHITLESECKEELEKAYEALKSALPKESVVDYDLHPLQNTFKKIMQIAQKVENPNILHAFKRLEQCYKKYKPEEVCVFLNSSKETTATLHLLHGYAREHKIEGIPRGFHIQCRGELPEVDNYLKKIMFRYTIQCDTYDQPVDAAINKLLTERPQTKAIIFGSPEADIKTDREVEFLKAVQVHSEVELINVLEGWTSQEVWDFIRSLYLPYFSPNPYL